ncbi:MAG: FAD-dependent monooxygenase [Actinomycetota bacterium]
MGASTSGLLLALELAREGLEVHVFERSEQILPSMRTLIVTQKVRELLGGLASQAIVHEIDRYELMAGDSTAVIALERPDLIIERAVLIRELAKRAGEVGVNFHLGSKVLHLTQHSGGLSLGIEGVRRPETGVFDAIVGADGVKSSVARELGLECRPAVPLLQAIVDAEVELPANTAQVWFRPRETSYFYWSIPESSSYVAIGLIADRDGSARKLLTDFLEERHLEAVAFQAAQVPIYDRRIPMHVSLQGGSVFLVGDAAGHVKDSTVGGLVCGFVGTLAVRDAILGRPSRGMLRRLRVELNLHFLVRRILSGFSDGDYVRLLRLLDGRVSRILGGHSRDEVLPLLISTCFARPRLVTMAMSALVSGNGDNSDSRRPNSLDLEGAREA